MKVLLIFLSLSLTPLTVPTTTAQAEKDTEVTVYYCIRHAEKDRSDTTNKNPNLTEAGAGRAQNWAKVLTNVAFDAVYSTDYNRTQQTAAPTAEAQGLKVQSYDPRDLYNTEFAQATAGKTILVVGHSNTTPVFVNKVLAKETYPWMDDNNNGGLYIVTKIGETVTVQVLQIN